MRSRATALAAVTGILLATAPLSGVASGKPCRISCDEPDVGFAPEALTASYVAQGPSDEWTATNSAPVDHPWTYTLSTPCQIDTAAGGLCRPDDDSVCATGPDRVEHVMVIQRQRLVLADGTTVDGFDPVGASPGTPVGPLIPLGRGCVDITALNPPPSPAEVYRYFQTLPLPDLPTQQQPPGNALAGLPVVFYTDGPTTQTFTVDIRGFTVDIVATASGFTWDTGDGTVLQTTDPGAPYPDHTISHDYRSGTYTAALTTTWSGTFSVNGGATADVPGTTTTDGPPATFTVLQASPVLTNPFD
jgi:hypothetical protein